MYKSLKTLINDEKLRAISSETALSNNLTNNVFSQTFEYDGQITTNTYPFSIGGGLHDTSNDFGFLIPFRYKILGFSAQAKNSIVDNATQTTIKIGLECLDLNNNQLGELEYQLSRIDPNGLIYRISDISQSLEVNAGILSLGVREIYNSGDMVSTCGDAQSKYRISIFFQRVPEL